MLWRKAGRQGEQNNVALVFRQFVQELARLLSGQRTFAAGSFFKEPDLWRLVDPFPPSPGANENGANQCKYRFVVAFVASLSFAALMPSITSRVISLSTLSPR